LEEHTTLNLKGVVEFHITSVCNLQCKNCNRFSNYKFKGWQRWEDYKEVYANWASKVNFPVIYILGGEPTLNPTFMEWFVGLRNLWPNSYITIVTNGTRLDKVPGLYDEVLKHKDKTLLEVNIHSQEVYHRTKKSIDNFLHGPCIEENDGADLVRMYDTIKGNDWPDTITNLNDLPESIKQEIKHNFNDILPFEPRSITDRNGVKIECVYSTFFYNISLIEQGNKFNLHNSDIKKAHDVCFSKKCHTMYKGKFYKCPVTALLPEFVDQNDFELSNTDRELVYNADSVDSTNSIDEIKAFWDFSESDTPVPQCKFCPANLETVYTEATFK